MKETGTKLHLRTAKRLHEGRFVLVHVPRGVGVADAHAQAIAVNSGMKTVVQGWNPGKPMPPDGAVAFTKTKIEGAVPLGEALRRSTHEWGLPYDHAIAVPKADSGEAEGDSLAKPETDHVNVRLPTDLANRLHSFAEQRGLLLEDVVRVATSTMLRSNKFYMLDTRLQFGKYAGEMMETVVRLDPGYVRWAINKIEGIAVHDDVLKLLDHMLQETQPSKVR